MQTKILGALARRGSTCGVGGTATTRMAYTWFVVTRIMGSVQRGTTGVMRDACGGTGT